METIGQRITRLRTAKGWSRPELGRQMATAIGRKKPFSGELIRLYEEGENRPRPDARRALANVFDKTEAFIEFGQSGSGREAREPDAEYGVDEFDPLERQLIKRYRAADPRWRLSLQLLAALATEDQIEAATDVNVIVARIAGKKPRELRPVGDERMRELLKDSPQGWPPKPPRRKART